MVVGYSRYEGEITDPREHRTSRRARLDEPDFLLGFHMLGIPGEDALRISREFANAQIPRDVLRTVMENAAKVTGVHPDKYPWHPSTFDEIVGGLIGIVDTKAMWNEAQAYVRGEYEREIPLTSFETEGASGAIANLMEMYALAKFHDLDNLKPQTPPYRQ